MGEIFGTDGIRDRAGHGFLAADKVVQVARAAVAVLRRSPAQFKAPIPPSAYPSPVTSPAGVAE